MEKLEIKREFDLKTVAEKILAMLSERKQKNEAAVLALTGDLGAGKTAFVKALARTLDIEDEITSPTFVILKLYDISSDKVKEDLPYSQLAHIDAYRIETIDEMRVLRFEELCASKDTIICIEWAEKIRQLLPSHAVHMHMEITGDGRTITIL